jgi:FlaA1/EpsC-like NDP-sugar epimerase
MRSITELSRFHKQLIAGAFDLVFLPLAFLLSIWLRYDEMNIALIRQYKFLILAVPLISIPVFIRLGLYRAVIRFINQKVVHVVVLGVSISIILLMALGAMTSHMIGTSRGVFGIYWVFAIIYMAVSRFGARAIINHSILSEDTTRVLIYGAGQAGIQLASTLRVMHEYTPVAFVDDNKELHGATIGGMRVFSTDRLPDLIERRGIKQIFLAIPSLRKARRKQILERLEPLKVVTKVTPPMESLLSGESRLQDIRNIEIEDLLGREPVAPNPKLISACISGRNVLVTGAGGSIGSELCRQIIRQRPARLLLLEISEFALYSIEQELKGLKASLAIEVEIMPFLGSVLDQQKCERIFETFDVETVYHAAAYKHVPLVEHNPIEGIRNNVFGTLSVALAATKCHVSTFVLISTDKAVRPTNVMGSTKRVAELILQAFAHKNLGTRFCMVRFGNVLGSSGSVVPLFRKQIESGGPVTLTHPEITRYFMTIPEAAQLVLQAGAMGAGGDVFVLNMGEPVKIMDLAVRMIHLSGLEVQGGTSASEGAIEIRHVGLRPGEKLYEELLIGGNVEGTEHPLIMRAQEAEIPWAALEEMLRELDDACTNFEYEKVRALLLKIVVEYHPQCEIEDFVWRKKNSISPLIDERADLLS